MDKDMDGHGDVPPLKMTVSHALSGSLTVLVGTIWVAPTAVTKGQTTGNLGVVTVGVRHGRHQALTVQLSEGRTGG